jgi:hypothetical protein
LDVKVIAFEASNLPHAPFGPGSKQALDAEQRAVLHGDPAASAARDDQAAW